MDVFESASKIEERIVTSATRMGIPLGGSFELLPFCNFDCGMCFVRRSRGQGCDLSDLRSVEEWLGLAREAKEQGLLFLLLTGGEPLMYPGFEELYLELLKMGFYVTVNTNGSLIDEGIADLFGKYMPRRVNVTLYGSCPEVYGRVCGNSAGFEMTMRGIRLLLERNVPVKLNGSLTRENGSDLEAMQEIAQELGVPFEVDSYMYPCRRNGKACYNLDVRLSPEEAAERYVQAKRGALSEEEFGQFVAEMGLVYEVREELEKALREQYQERLQELKKDAVLEPFSCRSCVSSFWMTWQGDMTPCVFLDVPKEPVFEIGFLEGWKRMRRRREQLELHLPEDCSLCGMRQGCLVCGACVYTETGVFAKKPEYMCRMTKEKLRLCHELMIEGNGLDRC